MTVVWFRQDLRLRDNPALSAALKAGGPVMPVFIWDEAGEGNWAPGAASRWWLHRSLVSLHRSLVEKGSRLTIRRGPAERVLRELIAETGATSVVWNRRYEPAVRERDATLKAAFARDGISAASYNSALLFEPHTVANREGKPFQVFGPYWRHCLERTPEVPVALPTGEFAVPVKWPRSLALDELDLLPKKNWAAGFTPHRTPGEAGAAEQLKEFVRRSMAEYDTQRDRPDLGGTSRLSPHLHHGEIGPRQVWAALAHRSKSSGVFPLTNGDRVFLTEIGWREFAHHLLFHFPETPERPLRRNFERFPWAKDPYDKLLRKWQQGQTGYPIVDAGMRQLWQTGWMHNRVRMIVASFLVKDLRLPWTVGAQWFWDTLVDADLANNTLGWQWSAGCGADAAPYFRIFSPERQAEKFDPLGEYRRAWVKELGTGDYPEPCVDHAKARMEALEALKSISAR
ncbi:MAG TPA: deoxyribodipyrimidine photo-lyase [Opitutaceae bacterium]